jgi:MFS family permease
MTKSTDVIRQPGFLKLWIGQSVSAVGSQITGLAIPVLAVTYLHANEFQMGLLNAADTSAFLVFGLLAGALVDRWIKRQVMLVADLVRMIAVAVTPLLWMLNVLNVYHLMIVGAVLSIATVFFDVSYQSYIPILLPKEYIGIGNARLEITGQISGIAGPGIVGTLLNFFKAPLLLGIDAVSFLVSATSLWFIKDREQPKPKTDRRPITHEISEGLKFVWNQRLIRAISFTTSTSNMFGTVVGTMFALYLLRPEYLGLNTASFGILMSIGSVGGLLGASVTPRLIKLVGEGPLVVLSALVSGAVQFLIPLAWYVPRELSLVPLSIQAFMTSFLALTYNITQVTARQRLCPEHLLGRMNASIRFMVWGSMPIGALIAGVLGTYLGVLPTIWVGATLGLFAAGFVLFSPLRTMRKMPDKPEEY